MVGAEECPPDIGEIVEGIVDAEVGSDAVIAPLFKGSRRVFEIVVGSLNAMRSQ